MLPVSANEIIDVARAVSALAAGPAGFGVHMNVVSAGIDAHAPTITLQLDKPSLQRAQNRVNELPKNFRGAARQNVQRVLNKTNRRIEYTPSGRRRDARAVFSKDLRAQQEKQRQLASIPQQKQVPFNLDQLSEGRKEQIAEAALNNGSQLPKGLTPPAPVMRRRSDMGLRVDSAGMAAPIQRRLPSRRPRMGNSISFAAAMKRWNVATPCFG